MMRLIRHWLAHAILAASMAIADAGFSLGCILIHGRKDWRERRVQYQHQGALQNHWHAVMKGK